MPELTMNYVVGTAPPSAKDAFHWDTEVKGFGLRVTPGNKKSFIVQGRMKGGSEARITIGSITLMSPDEAREVARKHLRLMLAGIDPRTVAQRPSVDEKPVNEELVELRRELAKAIAERERLLDLVAVIERDRDEMARHLELAHA
jgi:hypothetical protein